MERGINIVVATIGDPSRYQKVKYKMDDDEVETSLAPIALARFTSAGIVWLIAGFSLCRGCGNFKEGVEQVRQGVLGHVEQSCEEARFNCKLVDVIVAPNIYGTHFTSAEKEDPYFPYVYYQLYKKLVDAGGSVNEILLDTTHGINYMPTLTLEALRLAASVYSIKFEKEVKIKVYNTEPVATRDRQSSTESYHKGPYHYMKILEETISPKIAVSTVTARYLVKKSNEELQTLKKWEVRISTIDFAGRLARSLYNGLFLYVVSRGDGAREEAEELEKVLQNVGVKAEKVQQDAKAGANHIVIYEKHPIQEHAYLHALFKSVSNIVESYGGSREDLCMSHIKGLAEKYAPSEVVKSFIFQDIWRLEEFLKGQKISEWTLLDDVLFEKCREERRTVKDRQGCNTDRRTLYAHLGLAKRATYVKAEGEEICFSYRNCLKEVEKHL